MRPFTIPRHHSSSKKRFAPSLCLPPKCPAHPQAWSFPGAVGCREAVPAPCQSRAPGTARGLLSQESARREKTRAGRMWRVGRPPEVQPAVTALPGCGMAPLPPRHWGSGKSSSLTAPIRASPPGNLLPKKSELDLRHGCPEARGKPGFAPLRNPQHRSITEIPEHKGASQDGAAPDHVLLGTSCPQWGQARVRVPDGHIPAVGMPALSTPQGPADPPSSVISNGAVPAIPWQPHSWGISQPQAAGSSIFSPLCWRLSRLRQQRHPRSPPRAGLEPATAAQAWLEQGAAGPAQGEREGGRRRPKPPRARVFMERDNFSSRICQGNTQPGYQRAPLLQRDRLQDNVGQQRGFWQSGICLRGETWNLRSGLKGISADPEGSVFHGVRGKRASVTVQGSSCWNRGKSPSHAQHEPPGERRDCSGQWEGRGRCWE